MANYDDLRKVRALSKRGDTNSIVDLMKDEKTEEQFVRKVIFGVSQPLYQAIFLREIRALYKLNNCSNVVRILSHQNMVISGSKERVGVIFLEYIFGESLAKVSLINLSSKDKFAILKQLLNAIETAHLNGIIHRDINPSNIMITDKNEVKVIDFGICKIKEMVSKSTTYCMGTNAYSAPEVHIHSDNATEQSDLYSIGAVAFYLFTGKEPPLAISFQVVLNQISGIDIELKPIIRKLVKEDPAERYRNVFELKQDLSNLFTRFLNTNQQINVTMDSQKFFKLKNQNLLPPNAHIIDTNYISCNFSELYAFKTSDDIYRFVGMNYSMDCSFDQDLNIFQVVDFNKIVPIDREKYRRSYAEIRAKVLVVDHSTIHRQRKNDSFEIKNIIDGYYNEFMARNNVDAEYKRKYGVWKELLSITKSSIENNVLRLNYDSISQNNYGITVALKKGEFLGDTGFTQDQMFIFERKIRQNKKVTFINVGYYDDDYFDVDHVVLKLKSDKQLRGLPSKGEICLDYRQDIANVQRQIDALDTIEKEDYSCEFDLKKLLSGVEVPRVKILEDQFRFLNDRLDFSQQAAVKKALNSESICIIQGPPGTGKTNVIIEIIRQILLKDAKNPELPAKKILLVSQSHPAVDKMVEELLEQSTTRPNLIRIGRDEKLNASIKEEYGLFYAKEKWVKAVKKNCRVSYLQQCDELRIEYQMMDAYFLEKEKERIENGDAQREMIVSIESKTDTLTKRKIRQVMEIQHQWMEQLPQCEDVDLYIIKSTDIIAGTCTGFISNRVIRDADFDYLIIDEAAKATFPELAVSLGKANRIILVGDHKQLPPILDEDIITRNSDKIDRNVLSDGVFEKLYEAFPSSNKHRLTVQYRMHPAIGTLISKVFYENEIQNGIEKEKRSVDIPAYDNIAIEWLSTSSHLPREKYERAEGIQPRLTYRNDLELRIIRDKLEFIDANTNRQIKVGIITAYSGQKYAISNMVKQHVYHHLLIEVDTVDAFQGSQKEIIIYSTVRSSYNPARIGFLRAEARLNVAFSRAQSLLIIVGDQSFLNNRIIQQNRFPDIIEFIEGNECCRTISV